MRKNLLILAFAAMAMASQADVLTPEQALGRAMGNGPAKAASVGGAPTLVYTEMYKGQPTSYVFDKAQGGFMLLSADDAVAPVLGYSEEGAFDTENIPENLKSWLSMYSEEIAYARENGLTYQASAKAASYAAIAPLCTTMWNQDAPYNNLCPVATSNGYDKNGNLTNVKGQRAVTGCVATAMAQLMKYHNYPAVGEGSKNNYSECFPSLSINFADVPFEWANMTDTYTSSSTAAQKDAVAELMYACGMAVDMTYGTVASGAQSGNTANALRTYFKYDKGIKYLYRDYYSMTEWKDMCYNELKNVGPVLYSGTSNEGGHCFIVDGYDGQDYFHLNWGWGGISDGYYLLSALNPYSQGIGGYSPGAGFVSNQGMLLGARKPVSGSKMTYQVLASDNPFVISQSSTTAGGTITVDMTVYNFTYGATVSGTKGIFITSASGNRQYVGQEEFSIRPPGGGSVYGSTAYNVKLPSLSNGTYTVTPAWKSTDGTEYEIGVKVNLNRSYTMTVSGNSITFKATYAAPQMKATKLQVTSRKLYAGVSGSYRVTFTNTAGSEYYGNVTVGLYRTAPASGTKPAYTGSTFIVDCAPGETIEMPFDATFASAPAGTYKMAFYNPSNNYEILGSAFDVTFEVLPSDEDTKYTISDFGFVDGKTTDVDPANMYVKFTISCTAGYFHKDLYLNFVRTNLMTITQQSVSIGNIELYPGESKTVEVYASCSLNYHSRYHYFMYLCSAATYSSSSALTTPIEFYVADPSGIEGVDADQAVEVRYYNLQGMQVDFDQAAPGVYVRMNIYADGTTSTEKIRK